MFTLLPDQRATRKVSSPHSRRHVLEKMKPILSAARMFLFKRVRRLAAQSFLEKETSRKCSPL